MSVIVLKTAPSPVSCPNRLCEAINDDGAITAVCESVRVDDGVDLIITFDVALSGPEDTALDALIASFVCPSGGEEDIFAEGGPIVSNDNIALVGNVNVFNYEGAVAATQFDAADNPSQVDILIGTVTCRNDDVVNIPNNYPVYVTGFCEVCQELLVRIADASDPAKMPAMGITQFTNTTQLSPKDPITGVTAGGAGSGSFVVSGDRTSRYTVGFEFRVDSSTGNDGLYTVSSSSYSGGLDETTINVNEAVPSAVVDGHINGEGGFVIISGETRNCNTSGLTVNDPIYVAAGGGTTATKPTGANLIQVIGRSTFISPTEGRVLVFGIGRVNDIPNLPEDFIWLGDTNAVPTPISITTAIENLIGLDNLSDTVITTAAKGDVLVYNGTSWINVGSGTDGQVLTANSTAPEGVEWATNGGLYGSEYSFNERTTVSSTTSSTWKQYLELITPSLPEGTYRIGWMYVWRNSDGGDDDHGGDFRGRVQIDNTIDLINPADASYPFHSEASTDSGSNQRIVTSGFRNVELGAGSHEIDIDFSDWSSGTSYMYHAHIEIWRVL